MLPCFGVTTLSEVTFKKLGNLGHRSSGSTKNVWGFPPSLPELAEGRMETVWQLFCLFVYFSDKCFVFNPVTRVMQTTCLQPSTHYWTFTSYSWLIRLLGCKLVRAGTTFDLYIGFAFSMLVTILTQQVFYEHLWDCKLPARRAARPSGLCLLWARPHFSAMYMECFIFMFCSCFPFQPVSS